MTVRSAEPRRAADPNRTRTRLLAVLTTVAVVVVLKLAKPVLVPLVFALFLIVLLWPVQSRLERRLPRWTALFITTLVLLGTLAVIATAVIWGSSRVTEVLPQLQPRLERVLNEGLAWARSHGLPVSPGAGDRRNVMAALRPAGGHVLLLINSAAALLGLVFAYLLLGLLEVRDFEKKVEHGLRVRTSDTLLHAATEIASKVRRYMVALTLSSAICGALTGAYAWAMGVELAWFWGVLAFILNLIPTIGPALAVIPPSIYAILQFEGLARPAAVFFGIGAIQFFTGNFLDPKIGGRFLRLSPLVVLFAVIFWGWLWGVLGALVGVPITVALVIICQHFEGTRWIATLMSEADAERD